MHFSQILAEFMDAPNEKLVIQTNSPAMFAVFLPCLQVCLFFPQTKKQQLARYPLGERSHFAKGMFESMIVLIFKVGYVIVPWRVKPSCRI